MFGKKFLKLKQRVKKMRERKLKRSQTATSQESLDNLEDINKAFDEYSRNYREKEFNSLLDKNWHILNKKVKIFQKNKTEIEKRKEKLEIENNPKKYKIQLDKNGDFRILQKQGYNHENKESEKNLSINNFVRGNKNYNYKFFLLILTLLMRIQVFGSFFNFAKSDREDTVSRGEGKLCVRMY